MIRNVLLTVIPVAGLVACFMSPEDAVDALEACFAAVKALDGTILTSSGMVSETDTQTSNTLVFRFSADLHGAEYTCKTSTARQIITELTKDGVSVLDALPATQREF